MHIPFHSAHNRWIVAFSAAFMACFAIVAGTGRLFLERMGPEFRIKVIPDELYYVSFEVVAILFILGMASNAGLLLSPIQKPRGTLCLALNTVVLLVLFVLAGAYGRQALYVLSGGLHVSGSN